MGTVGDLPAVRGKLVHGNVGQTPGAKGPCWPGRLGSQYPRQSDMLKSCVLEVTCDRASRRADMRLEAQERQLCSFYKKDTYIDL